MFLVDANVILDVLNADPAWGEWSSGELRAAAPEGLGINPLIFAEVSINFETSDDLREALGDRFEFLNLPWEAAMPAGKAFLAYRQRGGTRTSPLPDFYIGAHAQVSGLRLLTRDGTRYRTYFPDIDIIAPA